LENGERELPQNETSNTGNPQGKPKRHIELFPTEKNVRSLARTPKPKTPRTSPKEITAGLCRLQDSVHLENLRQQEPQEEGATMKLRRTWWFLRRWRGRPCCGCGCWPWEPARPSRRPFPALSVSVSPLPPQNRGSCAGSQPWPPEWQSESHLRRERKERARLMMRAAGSSSSLSG
jgi:hypothetical protein